MPKLRVAYATIPPYIEAMTFKPLKSIRAVLLTAFAVWLGASAPATALTARDQADINRIQSYLNGMTTVAARFMQVSPDGGVATGSFYLSRPGKMRVEYDPPVDILMVSTGRGFFFYDGSVNQTTELDVEDTPAYFLVQPSISFGEDIIITKLIRTDDTLEVELVQRDEEELGSVALTFSKEPFQLVRWSVYDPDGQETKVALLDAVFGTSLEDRLFLYVSPQVKGPND